jgi:hypothetical protein
MCLARPSSTQNSNAANLSVKSNPGKSVRGRRELKYVQILSQNTQGFNEDKEEIILALMQQKNIFAYAIQETWRLGNEISEKYGYYVIQHGSESRPKKGHPSGGVAIILSPDAIRAWIKAGSSVLHFGKSHSRRISLSSLKWRTSKANQLQSCLQLLMLLSATQKRISGMHLQKIWNI